MHVYSMFIVGHDENGNLLCTESTNAYIDPSGNGDNLGGTRVRVIGYNQLRKEGYSVIDMTNYYNGLENTEQENK